jgi:hypothetical protein
MSDTNKDRENDGVLNREVNSATVVVTLIAELQERLARALEGILMGQDTLTDVISLEKVHPIYVVVPLVAATRHW